MGKKWKRRLAGISRGIFSGVVKEVEPKFRISVLFQIDVLDYFLPLYRMYVQRE